MKRMVDPNEIGNRVIRLPLEAYFNDDEKLIFTTNDDLYQLLDGVDCLKKVYIYFKGIYNGSNPPSPFKGEVVFTPLDIATDLYGYININEDSTLLFNSGKLSGASLYFNRGTINVFYIAIDDQDLNLVIQEAYVELCLGKDSPAVGVEV